jgi:tellurite resistance protein TehA-like permease
VRRPRGYFELVVCLAKARLFTVALCHAFSGAETTGIRKLFESLQVVLCQLCFFSYGVYWLAFPHGLLRKYMIEEVSLSL